MSKSTSPGNPPSELEEDDPRSETALVRKESVRRYLRIRPTADSLQPATITTHVHRLHRLARPTRDQPWYRRLLSSPQPQSIEVLLVSDGSGSLQYCFGIDDDDSFTSLERVLRGLFPDAYEFETVIADPLATLPVETDPTAVEFSGRLERTNDWQTQLTPFESFLIDENPRVPLASVVETMAEYEYPMVYQALLRPKPNWSRAADARRGAIEANHDTVGGQISNVLFGEPEHVSDHPTQADEERLEELQAKDTRRSFEVNARAIVIPDGDAPDSQRAADEVASALSPISRTSYDIEGIISTGDNAHRVLDDVRARAFDKAKYNSLRHRVPWSRPSSRGIVADPSELGSFFLLGGDALTAAGGRALAPTPGERTTIPRPPFEQLSAYRGAGLTLGYPLTQDGTPDDEPLVLPPDLQPLHVAWFGKTGAGKTTSAVTAILDNVDATDGANVIIDPKGDGMAIDYLRAHFARFGHLDNVMYFNCAEVLPAFSFFDIRDELLADVPRQTAVEDKVDHYVDILIQIMGRDRFEQAIRSPDVIRYVVKALFDPINGDDAYSHRDLHATIRRMHERQSAPSVSDPDLEQALGGVVSNRARTFDEIMGGVANRIEKIPVDQRLARIFNHVPSETDPHFDLADWLDEDVVIIFDTGDLRSEAQRVLTLVILSNLWTALRRRTRRAPDTDHPIVNVFVEEAASIAVSDLLGELLAQSRGFAVSLTLSMQYPAQLDGDDESAYDEVLNNVSTIVTGNVPDESRLTKRLATDDMDVVAVNNKLGALPRGHWFVDLPAPFDEPEPRPFFIRSASLPPGDPAGPNPLSKTQHEHFEAALEDVYARTLSEVGLTLAEPTPARTDDADAEEARAHRIDSALPYTKRLPPTVEYDGSLHALRCAECDNRYDLDFYGLRRTVECCSELTGIDPDDVPICKLNLKLSLEERQALRWSDRQLMVLQAVFNAQQRRYDRLEYDIRFDSMLRLLEYVGINDEEIQDLLDAGLLRHDTDHPHRLYSVSPEGRAVIGEHYRQGVDYGHGVGDLEESSEHIFGMEVSLDFAELQYVQSPDSEVVELVPYFEIDENRRLDIAGLDAEGNVVLAIEVERVNHDVLRAVPDDFDKMADCGVEEAIWVVMTRQGGHDVLSALNDPPDGEPRVEKTYSENTPPQQFRIDTPGCTAIYPVLHVRDTYLEDDRPG